MGDFFMKINSSLTYLDLLEFPPLKSCELVTDPTIPPRKISWVQLVSLPSEQRFFQDGDFLIVATSGLEKSNLLDELFQDLERTHCPGVLIYSYISYPHEFLDKLKAIGNLKQIPVMFLKEKINISQLCKSICTILIQQEFFRSSSEQIMHQLVTGNSEISAGVLNSLKLMGYNERLPYASMVIRIAPPEGAEKDTFSKAAGYINDSIYLTIREFCCKTEWGNQLLYIVPDQPNTGITLKDLLEKIFKEYHLSGGKALLRCGIGPRWTDINNFWHSMNIAEKLSKIPHRHSVLDIKNQAIFRILCQFENEKELYDIYLHLFGPLIEYDKENGTDLMKCLKVYLENDQNLQRSANELFLHINTMRNRIALIENLLNVRLRENKWSHFRLYLGFFLEDYLSSNTTLLDGQPLTSKWTHFIG